MDYTTFIPILVAAAAPIGAYLLAARRMSGKIVTSDASQLWSEAAAIRNDYKTRLEIANERYTALEERVAKLESEKTSLIIKNTQLESKIIELQTFINLLQKKPGG